MYYVLMTDLVRVPSPALEAQHQNLFGLSLSARLAPGSPDNFPAPQNPDSTIAGLIGNLMGIQQPALRTGLQTYLGPIVPWSWKSITGIALTDGQSWVKTAAVIAGPGLEQTSSFPKLVSAIETHLLQATGAFQSPDPFVGADFAQTGVPGSIPQNSTVFSYQGFLASLAVAPPPLAHAAGPNVGALNLSMFFALSDSDLGTLPTSGLVAALPIFQAADGTTTFSYATSATPNWFKTNVPPPSGPGQPTPQQPDQIIGQWRYDTPFQGHPVVVQTLMRDPRAIIDSPDSFVNMKTLWVRRQHDNAPGSPGKTDPRTGVALDDWVQNLPGNLAKLFDLPRRFLDLFRDANGVFLAVPLTIPDSTDPTHTKRIPDPLASRYLVHATLRALYDVLAPGIWGKQGDQTTGRSGLALTTLRALYGLRLPPTQPPHTFDDVITTLWKQDQDIRNGFQTLPDGSPNNKTSIFCGILAARVGLSLGLPTGAVDFVPALFAAVGSPASLPSGPDTTSTNLETLDRLVTLATDPDTAAAIYADLWNQALQGLSLPNPLQGNINSVAKALGLPDAQRRQIASFALAQAGIFNTGSTLSQDIELLQANILNCVAGYVFGTLATSSNPAPPAPTAPNVDPETVFAFCGVRASALDRDDIARLSANPPLGVAGDAIKTAMASWVPPAGSSSTTPFESFDFVPAIKTTGEAGGLNFQLDRIVLGGATASHEDFNFLLAGYAFLMRRTLRRLKSGPGRDPAKRDDWEDIVQGEKWRLLNATQGAAGPWPMVPLSNPPVPDLPEAPANRFHTAGSSSQLLELIAPTPIATSGGMPRVSFKYNNAAPAGSNAPSQVTHTHMPTPEMADGAPSVFHLIQPIARENPPKRELLLFLAYGLSYDLVVFAITNQGAVPEELRPSTSPAMPAFPAAIPPGDAAVDAEVLLANGSPDNFKALVRSVRYLRTTSVGHLGFHFNPPTGYNPFQAPKDVTLVAAEIDGLRRQVDAGSLISSGTPTKIDPVDGRKSCLLLAPASANPPQSWTRAHPETCGFTISAPACSLEVLDRWLARDEYYPPTGGQSSTIAQLRRTIRSLYASESETRQNDIDNGRKNANTLKLEDPAVSGFVVTAQLYRRGGTPVSPPATTPPTCVSWPSAFDPFLNTTSPPPQPTMLSQLTRLDIAIQIAISSNALSGNQVGVSTSAPTSGKGTGINLTVNAGDVVLVSFQAAVLDDYFKVDTGATARFDPIVLGDPNTPSTYVDNTGGKTYRLFDPIEMVVEAAQANLPDADSLYSACGFEVFAGNGQRQILLDWTRPTTADVTWDAVGAIETGDIAWSFAGRPVTRYPFEEAQADKIPGIADTPQTNPLLWEVETFADRATLAPAVKVFPIPLLPSGQTVKIPIQTLGPRGPAGIKRYEIIVRNRYAAAYQQVANSGVIASRRAKHTQPSTTSSKNTWVDSYRRLLVPAVPPDNVPEPTVRALVPLTRNIGDAGVAGLLVILDGAYGDVGGVAEWLDVGVDVVQRELHTFDFPNNTPPVDAPVASDDASRVVVRRAEIGADPLLRPYPRGIDASKAKEGYRFMPLRATGPLGHTFDTAASVGLFNATSFMIEPPQIAASDPGAWWMAKLKLRRTIMAEGIAQQTPVSLSQSPATLPINDQSGKAQGYLNQWSLSLIGLPLPAQSTTPQSIGLSMQRIGSNPALPGAPQSLLVCWAKDSVGQFAIWLASIAPTAIPDEALRISNPHDASTILTGQRLTFAPTLRRVQIWNATTSTMSNKVVLRYNVALQVRTTGEWLFAGDFDLWNDQRFYLPDGTYDQRLQLSVSWQGNLLQTAQKTFVCVAPQVSDWVVSHWGRFLPEANRLVSLPAVAVALEQNPIRLEIKGANWWFYTSDLAAKRAAQKADQGLFHLVMLSRSVRSANGRDSEAYQGLFWDVGQAPGSTLTLRPFGSSATIEPSGSSNDFRWRLLTIRTANPSMKFADIHDALAADPWRLFFPQELDGGVDVVPDQPSMATMMPCDALLQIIEISGWQQVVQQ